MRLRLDVAYDGTDFHGWARQPGLRTVEGELAAALHTVLRLAGPDLAPGEGAPAGGPVLVVAGRTDAGVHARGQVVHADVARQALLRVLRPTEAGSDEAAADRVCHRLRGLLPDDLTVRAVTPAPDGFDARFSALWRRYRYRLVDGGPVDPLRRRSMAGWRHPLDVDAMADAAHGLLGEHDFLPFCRPRPGASTVRELQRLTVERSADHIRVEVQADAFCHHMVRALVGALVAVGEGRRAVGWPEAVLLRGERDPSVTVMPPHGLVLEEVGYPDTELLAARADQARRRRDVRS